MIHRVITKTIVFDTRAPFGRKAVVSVVVLWLVAGLMMSPQTFAQEAANVRVSFTSDRLTLTVGDLVTLTLQVTHSPAQTVALPRLQQQWGQFEVRAQPSVKTVSNDDGTATTIQQMQVTLFTPGAFQTPDFPISVRNSDGTVDEVLPLPISLNVTSVLPGNDQELKDIRSQADLSTPFLDRPLTLALGTLLLVVVSAVIVYYVYKRWIKKAPIPLPVIDSRTLWDIAIQELDRIERLDLPEDGRFKEHYTLIADVMRVYVQAMFLRDVSLVDAIDMTTDEIVAALRNSLMHRDHLRLVIDLLQEADLVKFAKYGPGVSQAYEASGQGRYIVELTKPSVEPQVSHGTFASGEVHA